MTEKNISKERYEQLLDYYDYDKEDVDAVIAEWSEEEVNNGYAVFDFDGTGILAIERIDDLGVFESDEEAVEQAIKDGVRVIPLEKLPNGFELGYYGGFIDTEENRKAIQGKTRSLKNNETIVITKHGLDDYFSDIDQFKQKDKLSTQNTEDNLKKSEDSEKITDIEISHAEEQISEAKSAATSLKTKRKKFS